MKKIITILALAATTAVYAQVPTTGLTAYYPFDGNTNDYGGTPARNGVPVGPAQYATDRWGNPNHCYNVVNNTNYIQLPADVWVSGDYSISAWVYVTALCSYPRLYDFANGYGINDVIGKLSHAGNSRPTMENWTTSTAVGSILNSPVTLTMNKWYHIVFIQQGTTMFMYINNVLSGTLTGTIPPENISRSSNKIGGSNAPLSDETKAYIDDFRIYDRALNTQEVSQLYHETPVAGIEQLSGKLSIDLYPNPATGQFVIETTATGKQTVNVYDISGKIVLSQVINGTTTIDATQLSAGAYNVSITCEETTVNKKLVIVR